MISSPYTILLRTGWFHILLDCGEVPTWISPIQKRYHKFISPFESGYECLQISLLPLSSEVRVTANKLPKFLLNEITFSPPGWEGQYIFSKKTGWVRPASSFIYEEIDYFLRVVCAMHAFQSGGLLLHAAGILRNHKAYVFLGHSGAGKTTVARLSGEQNVLNDDLILLESGPSGWAVHSTPFFNPTQIAPSGNHYGPLAKIFHLVQDQQVYLEKTQNGQALAELIANVPVISTNPLQTIELMSRCQALIANVPSFRLHFRKDESFWEVIENS